MKALVLPTIVLAGALAAVGQSADEPRQGPVQAELLAHLNVRHLTPESTIFARVTLEWNSPECVLRQGSILEAKVEVAEMRKYRHDSRLSLSFVRGQCNGTEMRPLNLMLAAIADPPANWAVVPDAQVRMPISFSNPHGNGMLAGIGSAAPGDLYSNHLELTGIEHRFPMRPDLKPGAVIGIKDLRLDLATGPDRASVLSSRTHDVALGAYTQLLLVPTALAFRPNSAVLTSRPATAASTRPAPSSIPADPVDTLDTCAPPGCAVDLPLGAHELATGSASSIALRPLGYTPRSNKIVDGFDNEEELAWLGSGQLLFTYNPHRLINRAYASPGSTAPTRVIRAVLLNAETRSVIRAVDWEIADSRRYLWQLDNGRILAHIGNELRVYSAGLEVERTLPVGGPLSFVRISPNGQLMALGILRERHTPDLHNNLRDATGTEPEEDVDVSILDGVFRTMAHTSTISGLLPPTLLNEGQVNLLAQPNLAYRLAMRTWAGESLTLARFSSLCTPQISSMAPDLLLLLTCNAADGATEYRILRGDGKMLLRGKSGPRAIGHDASGNSRNDSFAMKIIFADRELSPGAPFKGSELDSEELRVYAARDGKRLLALRLKDPSTSRAGYAFSPSGSQLAVLSGREIRLFQVPE